MVLGKSYSLNDKAQGNAVLESSWRCIRRPRGIATKIARHFIADDPPNDVVTRLAQTYLQSGGDLGALTRAVRRAFLHGNRSPKSAIPRIICWRSGAG